VTLFETAHLFRRLSLAVRFQATRRLLRDWKEVQKEPIKTVKASPLENNLRSVAGFFSRKDRASLFEISGKVTLESLDVPVCDAGSGHCELRIGFQYQQPSCVTFFFRTSTIAIWYLILAFHILA
jgi:hypothetical protein